MAEARQRDAWNHTASIMALVRAAASGKKQRIEDFHPFMGRREDEVIYVDDITILKDIFVDKNYTAAMEKVNRAVSQRH